MLRAGFSASPFDEHYQMALVYCTSGSYCFSLSRFPDRDTIQVMVLDQIHKDVPDLSVELEDGTIYARLDEDTAAKLDGYTHYIVHLGGAEAETDELHAALNKIFEGKKGLRIAP